MRFTTLSFLVFFGIVYLVYWACRGRARLYVLLVSSLVFYAAWSVPFALHFVAIVAINYWIVRQMFRQPQRSGIYMRAAVAIDLANLFLFKYFYLFLTFLYDLSGAAIFQHEIFNEWLYATTGNNSIILPLAISFYSFQVMAYVVDVHRRQITEQSGPLEFFVFILFFPQLVAGPIMRHSDFFYQLRDLGPNEQHIRQGLYLLLIGMIKKVVVADNLVGPVQSVFAAPGDYDWLSNVMAVFGFAARVYCDFSGYTDVARGLGYLLGLKLPENFRAPYLSDSARDLWQRWHITLTTWLRDYIYIPLGGNRRGRARTYFNLIATFTLGGLWHGANYTYILWGFLHGVALAVERLYEEMTASRAARKAATGETPRAYAPRPRWFTVLTRGLRMLAVFLVFCLGIIPFNSPDIYRMWDMVTQISLGGAGIRSKHNDFLLAMLAIAMFFNYLQFKEDWRFTGLLAKRRVQYGLLMLLGFVTLALIGRYAPGGFDYIYFQF